MPELTETGHGRSIEDRRCCIFPGRESNLHIIDDRQFIEHTRTEIPVRVSDYVARLVAREDWADR